MDLHNTTAASPSSPLLPRRSTLLSSPLPPLLPTPPPSMFLPHRLHSGDPYVSTPQHLQHVSAPPLHPPILPTPILHPDTPRGTHRGDFSAVVDSAKRPNPLHVDSPPNQTGLPVTPGPIPGDQASAISGPLHNLNSGPLQNPNPSPPFIRLTVRGPSRPAHLIVSDALASTGRYSPATSPSLFSFPAIVSPLQQLPLPAPLAVTSQPLSPASPSPQHLSPPPSPPPRVIETIPSPATSPHNHLPSHLPHSPSPSTEPPPLDPYLRSPMTPVEHSSALPLHSPPSPFPSSPAKRKLDYLAEPSQPSRPKRILLLPPKVSSGTVAASKPPTPP